MNNLLQETDLILDGIAASSTELALVQCEEAGGGYAWYYIGIDEARKIIKTVIIEALRKHEHFIMSNQKRTAR